MANGYSLHIGLNSVDPNHYDGWSGPLVACEADAAAMRKICQGRGFQPKVLLTALATRPAVLDHLSDLATSMIAGDTLIVSYSGHGGQLPDRNGDEDDGLDETWCLFDGQLLDDELYRAWANFKPGVRIAVFSDSCHSGTVIKELALAHHVISRPLGALDPSAGYRIMPPEIQYRTYEANREFYDDLLQKPAPPPEPACTVLLVSGCQDNQLSQDGAFNGKFTGALISTWANGKFKGTYAEFTKAIRKRLPSSQSPNYLPVGVANPQFTDGEVFSV
ncbi:caspase family protein [Sphingopyxis sp. GC21]|uniref:caspase family protein n=1 Tax=Sphingopyxis sp. GC21 TaxID=2933562 RepID=UPI0021E3AB4E|nr:caspase family protein [Sphingopyxis sp. GC21]